MTNRFVFLAGRVIPSALVFVAAGCSAENSSGTAGHGTTSGASSASAEGSGSPLDAQVAPDAASGTGASSGIVSSSPPGRHPTTPGSDASAGAPDGAAPNADATTQGPADAAIGGWRLTWSDEFDGPDGSAVDPTKWKHDVGGTGWGNNELEYYTDGTQNAVIQGGNLVITATPQNASQYKCSYGTCKYTSARLKTEGLFSQQYGRFEARAQMPTGKGLWPAIWALGDNIATVSWPTCGEIDFLETIGSDIATNHGSLHMPKSYGPTGTYKLANGATFADSFHTFAIEWEPGTIRFYVDDQLYETQNRSAVPAGDTWEFEHPFFLLINVAVGGQWPGSPDSTTTFPQTLKVDYVRVYQKDATEP